MGNQELHTSVIAYADDVTIFVTSIADFPIIEEAIRLFERASGAGLNPRKSKAMAVGGWCTKETVLGIDYHTYVTILGITFWGTIAQTINDSWARLSKKVRLQAKQAYTRDQCITHRIRYVHGFLLFKLWYTAQVLPAVRPYTQQLSTAITWCIWRGAVFIVPVSTLQKPKKDGGWGLLDLEAQCRALLLCRMYVQSKEEGTMTAAWMESSGLAEGQQNPPNANRTLKHFVYLYTYTTDMAYIKSPEQNESLRAFRKRTYTTLHTMELATKGIRDMRVVQLHPDTHFTRL